MGRQLRVQLLPTWHTYTRHVANYCIIPISNSKDEKAYIQVKTLLASMYWYGINVAIPATRLWVPHSQMIHFHERTNCGHRRHRQKHNSRYKSLEAAGVFSCTAEGGWRTLRITVRRVAHRFFENYSDKCKIEVWRHSDLALKAPPSLHSL